MTTSAYFFENKMVKMLPALRAMQSAKELLQSILHRTETQARTKEAAS